MCFFGGFILCHHIQATICFRAGSFSESEWHKDGHCPDLQGALWTFSNSNRPHRYDHKNSHCDAHHHDDAQQHRLADSLPVFHRHTNAPHAEARRRSDLGLCFHICASVATDAAPTSANKYVCTSCPADSTATSANAATAPTDSTSAPCTAHLTTRSTHEKSLSKSARPSDSLPLELFFLRGEEQTARLPFSFLQIRNKKGRSFIGQSILFASTWGDRLVCYFANPHLDRLWGSGQRSSGTKR